MNDINNPGLKVQCVGFRGSWGDKCNIIFTMVLISVLAPANEDHCDFVSLDL